MWVWVCSLAFVLVAVAVRRGGTRVTVHTARLTSHGLSKLQITYITKQYTNSINTYLSCKSPNEHIEPIILHFFGVSEGLAALCQRDTGIPRAQRPNTLQHDRYDIGVSSVVIHATTRLIWCRSIVGRDAISCDIVAFDTIIAVGGPAGRRDSGVLESANVKGESLVQRYL